MLTVVGLLAASTLLFAAPEQELTLQQVLKANTAAFNAIRSIHVTIDVANNNPMSGEDKPPADVVPTYTYEWFKDGDRERVRMNWLRGRKPNNYDIYNGPHGYKRLNNYDPDFKPPLSEAIDNPASGNTDKTHTDTALGGPPRARSYVEYGGHKLEEYLLKQPTTKLAATPATSKLGCYEITHLDERSPVPGSSFKEDDMRDVRIFVDPKVGFWIRRIERGPWKRSTDPGDKGTGVTDVQEFKDCGNGIYWPLRAHQSVRLPGAKTGMEISVRHTLHSINQPLPEEDFEIHFPDWLRVYDQSSDKVTIWGPDDKPRMEFASTAEYNKWYQPRMKAPFPETNSLPRQTRWGWLVGISVGVGLLLLVLILWRRGTKRVDGGTSSATGKPQGDASVMP